MSKYCLIEILPNRLEDGCLVEAMSTHQVNGGLPAWRHSHGHFWSRSRSHIESSLRPCFQSWFRSLFLMPPVCFSDPFFIHLYQICHLVTHHKQLATWVVSLATDPRSIRNYSVAALSEDSTIFLRFLRQSQFHTGKNKIEIFLSYRIGQFLKQRPPVIKAC